MRKMLCNAGLALVMAAGTMTFPTISMAQDIQLRIGPDGVQLGESGRSYRDRDRERDRDWERGRGRGCSSREAVSIARSEGLRRARVVRANDRRIVVAGETRRGPDSIVFANRRGCPIIG